MEGDFNHRSSSTLQSTINNQESRFFFWFLVFVLELVCLNW